MAGSGRVDSAIWMHYLDAIKTAGEEARRQLHKNLASNIEQVLAAHTTRHQLYGHLSPIMKTIQARRNRHGEDCRRSKDELISDVLLWNPAYGQAKAGRQLEHTYSSYVRIRDVALKTCLWQWMIGLSGEIGSWISVLAARHGDDGDDYDDGW